jgi:hypothetical protein
MHSYLTAFADSDQLRKEKFGANKKVHAKRDFFIYGVAKGDYSSARFREVSS